MLTEQQRRLVAVSILNFEARRDRQGRLAVYKLPAGDGGGTFEVAGINDRYHPVEATMLADLIKARRFEDAEERAIEIIATLSDGVSTWSRTAAVESYLRDTAFNRGPTGGARILQRAVAVPDDGVVGPVTRAAVERAERDAPALLRALRAARESYEREVVGRDESSKFWKGLVNRWDNALSFASSLLAADVTSNAGADRPRVALPSAVPSGTDEPVLLRALRLGSRGDLVRAWQSFLLGSGFDPGEPDGDFGGKTAAATQAFQRRNGLDADGVAGRQTLMAAMRLGFELIEEPAGDESASSWPPRPNFAPLVDTAARRAVFGAFEFVPDPRPDNRENIRILGTWEQDNIVNVAIPQLRTQLGAAAPKTMRFHRLAANQLQTLWAAWEQAGLLDRVSSYAGAFVPRFIRGSSKTLSNHAFGSAFDINAPENPLGARPALVGQPGSVRELVPIAHRHGFYWGGHFSSRPDGMHFEVAHLL